MNDKELKHRLQAIESAIKALQDRVPRQENNASVGPESHPDVESPSAPREIPVVSPPPSHPKYPKQGTEKPVRWWQFWRYPKERLEKMGIVAGIFYAVITCWQWRDLRSNFKIDERAWVGLSLDCADFPEQLASPFHQGGGGDTCPVPTDLSAQPIAVTVVYRNNGKTPAMHVTTYANWADSESSIPKEFPKFGNLYHSESAMQPGNISSVNPPIPPEVLERINRGDTQNLGVIYGIIYYGDVFGREHWTKFCTILQPHFISWPHCQTNNETDD